MRDESDGYGNADGHRNGNADGHANGNDDGYRDSNTGTNRHGNDNGNTGPRALNPFTGCGPICLFRPCCRPGRLDTRRNPRIGLA